MSYRLLTKHLQAGKKIGAAEITAIPPNQAVLKNAREHDYSLGEALAEFVDNSIDKKVPGKPLNVDVTIQGNEIIVSDNASGMDYEGFIHALTYGENDPNRTTGAIGKFGMGWKHAAFFLANKVTISSTQFDMKEILHTEINVKEWSQSRGFKFNIEKLEKKHEGQRGTITKLTELVQKLEHRKAIQEVSKHMSETYEPLLADPQIILTVNNKRITPSQSSENLENITKLNFHFKDIQGNIHHIQGWIATKNSQNVDKQRGLSLYTSKRRLEESSMIAIKDNPKATLIVGKIYGINFLQANISKKRVYSKNDKNYDKFEQKLFEAIKNTGFFEAIHEDKRESAVKIDRVERDIQTSLVTMQKILIDEFNLKVETPEGTPKEGTGIFGSGDFRKRPGTPPAPGPHGAGSGNRPERKKYFGSGEIDPKGKTNRILYKVADLGENNKLIDYIGESKEGQNHDKQLTIIINIGHPSIKGLKGDKLNQAILINFIVGSARGWAQRTKHNFNEIYERLMKGVKL